MLKQQKPSALADSRSIKNACCFIPFARTSVPPERLRFNGLNRPESLDKQEFSRGVAVSGPRRGGVETAGFCGDSGSICQQFEGIVYLGLKQRLHDRWRGENLPSLWRRTQASTRKLLSADSFISVDIYQVNYPSPSNVYYHQHRLCDVRACV